LPGFCGVNMDAKVRTGIGIDAHPLVAGRRLVLGGVEIPFDKGLNGWSDGDALTHAIIDAMLGAAALGDIGQHFPPGDVRYKDVSSISLLKQVNTLLAGKGWQVGNIDVTVVASAPKLSGVIEPMRQKIGEGLNIDIDCISIKASSGNGLGFAGRGEGIAAHAVATIIKK
jgi:2-C-methyl-D-erythritol 2,4-cyclodiphosphate synthase